MSEDGSVKLARDLSPGDVIRVHGKACVVENVYTRPGDPPKVLVRHTHGEESYFANAEVLIIKPSPLAGVKLWEYLDKSEDVRNLYLEMMTAAYLSMTDIPPDRVSLVQDVSYEDGHFRTVWYLKERDSVTTGFPKKVCLCGSTRFGDAFAKANLGETLEGNIVLTVGVNTKSDYALFGHLSQDEFNEIKMKLDELHLRKIDLADEVLILNVGGYVGESTMREYKYAKTNGKVIRWLEPDKALI